MLKRGCGTPHGVHDVLFAQSRMRRQIGTKLTECYEKRGYAEVKTPLLEYYDLFLQGESASDTASMYKLVDGGEVLVIRPDSTAPIGRLVSSRLQTAPLPLRLYYHQDVFRVCGGHRGERAQTTQCGVELIGAKGLRADTEIAETALRALAETGLQDYKIELGHAGIFRALADAIEFREGDGEKVRYLTEIKNYAAVNDVLKEYDAEYHDACEALRRLPRIFGGGEIFAEAEQIIKTPAAAEALAYLKTVYEALCALGCGDRVVLDLALVNHMEYYTGIVLSGYAHGTGEPIISGGRYDTLIASYGMDVAATGFVVNVDAVAEALEKSGLSAEPTPAAELVHYEPEFASFAYAYAAEKRAAGYCVELSCEESVEAALAVADQKEIPVVVVFDAAGIRRLEGRTAQ